MLTLSVWLDVIDIILIKQQERDSYIKTTKFRFELSFTESEAFPDIFIEFVIQKNDRFTCLFVNKIFKLEKIWSAYLNYRLV